VQAMGSTGQILDAIKEAGIEDNTLLIFASSRSKEAATAHREQSSGSSTKGGMEVLDA